MALPLPHDSARTLPRIAPVLGLTPTVRDRSRTRTPSFAERPAVVRLRAVATSPTTGLVVLLLGLALLFLLPAAGLPFVALVVLPAVVYHLRAEHRVRLSAASRRRSR